MKFVKLILIFLTFCTFIIKVYSVTHIQNGESGLSTRNKLNTVIDSINNFNNVIPDIQLKQTNDSVYFEGLFQNVDDSLLEKYSTVIGTLYGNPATLVSNIDRTQSTITGANNDLNITVRSDVPYSGSNNQVNQIDYNIIGYDATYPTREGHQFTVNRSGLYNSYSTYSFGETFKGGSDAVDTALISSDPNNYTTVQYLNGKLSNINTSLLVKYSDTTDLIKSKYSAKLDSIALSTEINSKLDSSKIPNATAKSAVLKNTDQTYEMGELKDIKAYGIPYAKIDTLNLGEGIATATTGGDTLTDIDYVKNQIASSTGNDSVNLNNSLLFFNYPEQAYQAFPSQKTWVSFDTSNTDPTLTKRLNINAQVSATTLAAWASGSRRGLTINNVGSTSLGIGIYGCINGIVSQSSGKDFEATGSQVGFYSSNTNNFNAFESIKGTTSTSNCLSATHGGSGNAIKFLLSATSSGNAISGRVYSTLSTRNVIAITDTNDASVFNLKANGNLTIKGQSQATQPIIKLHRNDTINVTNTNWNPIKWQERKADETRGVWTFLPDSTGIISGNPLGLYDFGGCQHWKWNGGGASGASIRSRVTVNSVEKKCSQSYDKRDVAADNASLLVTPSGTVLINLGDTVRFEYKMSDVNLDLDKIGGFDNEAVASFNLRYIGK